MNTGTLNIKKLKKTPNFPRSKMNRRVADFVFSNVKTREFTYVNDRSLNHAEKGLNHAEKAEDAPLYSFWEPRLIEWV